MVVRYRQNTHSLAFRMLQSSTDSRRKNSKTKFQNVRHTIQEVVLSWYWWMYRFVRTFRIICLQTNSRWEEYMQYRTNIWLNAENAASERIPKRNTNTQSIGTKKMSLLFFDTQVAKPWGTKDEFPQSTHSIERKVQLCSGIREQISNSSLIH